MSGGSSTGDRLPLGDPAPWFSARTVAGATVDIHVQAGRWVVLAFLASLDEARTAEELAELLGQSALFDADRLVVYGVLPAPPRDSSVLVSISGAALGFLEDYDGAISRSFGAFGSPRTFVLDPMLRAVANIGWDDPNGHAVVLRGLLQTLPEIDDSAGVPLFAPALIVPRVFDFPLCDFLVELYDGHGGTDSGFLMAQDGRTATVVNHRLKQRQDLVIGDPELRGLLRDRIVRRLLPAIERHLQFAGNPMDRYLVSCYDGAVGGHFFRHRDNLLPGARHRRFAVSINLNHEYEGCDLVFPEFGHRTYRPPTGGAIVFATSTLHEVTPIKSGRRFVFVPFLYGEADVERRIADNALLGQGSVQYAANDDDRLFPAAAAE